MEKIIRKWYKKHFPDYKFKCFTCHSWLLDETLENYLKPDSNIIKFGELFTPVEKEESYILLKFMFKCDTNYDNLKNYEPTSSFARKIKEAVLAGERFYEVYGAIENK